MSEIEVPKEWKESSIGSIASLITKGSTPTTYGYSYTEKGIPFLRAENILENRLELNQIRHISKESHEFLKRSKIKPGDVLITIAGTIGRSTYVPKNSPEMNSNQAVALIRLKNSCYPEFLSYFLNSQLAKKQITDSKVTTSIPNLSLAMIEKMTLFLPPLETQKKIVQKLDYILGQLEDKKKEINILINLNKEKLKIINHNMFRFHISKFFFYENNSKELTKKSFSEVTVSFDGLRVPLNKSERSKIQGKYPYYGASGYVDSINDYKFDGKFLLIAEDGENINTQKKPIAFIVEGKFWVNNHAHVVQTTQELDLNYLCYYLNGLRMMNYAQKQSTRPKLNKSDLNKIPIVFPEDIRKQRIMVNKTEKITQEIDIVKNKIINLMKYQEETSIKINLIQNSILNIAFSGKLVN